MAMVAVADREQANTSPQYLFQDKKFLDMNCILYLSKKSVLPIYGVAVWWTADTLTLKKMLFVILHKKFSTHLVYIPVKRRLV